MMDSEGQFHDNKMSVQVIRDPGVVDSRGDSEMNVSRISSKRMAVKSSRSKFMAEGSLEGVKGKKGKKRKKRYEVVEEGEEKQDDASKILYDEYEDNTIDQSWTSPKPKASPHSQSSEGSLEGVKGKKGKKRKKRYEVVEEGEEKQDDASKILYDEYEDDAIDQSWTSPKPEVPPRPSELLREWAESQPIPDRIRGKKMTKKAVKKLEKERAKAAAAEAERVKIRLIKEMHEEIRLEKINSDNRAQLDEQQMTLRKGQLETTWYKLYDINKEYVEYELENKDLDAWKQYMTCDGLPDPNILSDMNTYMFLWSQDDEEASMDMVAKKSEVVIYLLNKLENIIHFSILNPQHYTEECRKIRHQFREKLQFWLDMATYRLLRQIERDMIREDLRNARYVKMSGQMVCCIWALIRLPISIKQIPDRDKKSVQVTFDEFDLTVKMPIDLDCYSMAIRGMWVKYDHYSDQGTSYNIPELPEEYQTNMDMLGFCQSEYDAKLRIREEQVEGRQLRLEEKKALVERMANPPPPAPLKDDKKKQLKKSALQQGKLKKAEPEPEPEPLPYLPTPEEILLMKEGELRKEVRRLLFTRCEKTELNLRKYTILGGVIHIDLVYQPPQPKDMRRDIFLTTLQLPKELKFVPFEKPYKAPPAALESDRSPEVIEAEMKALENAMEALALVTLTLPDSVLWFEPPLVAHWIPEKKVWSTQDVHDIKYNEEKQIITFRAGRLGIHGLACYRYINLPFQSWELRPESGKGPEGGVILSITAAIVQAEFIIREDLVCLHSLIGGTTTALQDLVDQYMKLHFLIRNLRAGGCDLFPEGDAHSYVKGLPVKHPVTEKHLQECMGLLCTAYIFGWSRWNATCTPRQIVMQLKEVHGSVAKQVSRFDDPVADRLTCS